ncbi:Uncharacterised protein [Legionella donaldsonii]|uniref:ATPase involved in DNA repair n=1 Tax=Legionella donaldsonii TaxID=45060 RepID=A0A378J105_9GAMM|nr:hypothetical protein [Legionella donaldsonii]STX41422.1 Uncharacterised protein [Legionella donaldsonii]
MLELYVWNPRNKNKQDLHGSLKGIAKAVVQGGNVGHMSLAVTLYENKHNLSEIDKKFKQLKFQQAMPIYEAVKTGDPNGLGFYKRGKKLKGLSAFLSLWPGDEGITKLRAIQSFFRVGGKVKSLFSEKVQMDMRGEWSDSTDESPSSKRIIEHHRGSEFEPSELSQKMQAVDNRIAELEKQKQEMRAELEKKGRAPQTAMEKKLEARRKLLPQTTPNVVNLLSKPGVKKPDDGLAAAQEKQALEKELKQLKVEFHNLLLNADMPKIYAYIEEYRTLTSEFNKINTLYDDEPDSNKVRRHLRLYFQRYPENEDAQALLALQTQITDTMNKLRDLEKEEHQINELLRQYENIKKELHDLKQEKEQIELELENSEVTEGLSPDHKVSLPTSECGQPYFLDEIAILKKMERLLHDPNYKYDLFGQNCARAVKECVMAGLSETTRKAIKKLPDYSKHFFDSRFFETPVMAIEWIFKLNHYLNELNQDPGLRAKIAVSPNHKPA